MSRRFATNSPISDYVYEARHPEGPEIMHKLQAAGRRPAQRVGRSRISRPARFRSQAAGSYDTRQQDDAASSESPTWTPVESSYENPGAGSDHSHRLLAPPTAPRTHYKYLKETSHIDDYDGIEYETTRVVVENGYIVAYRKHKLGKWALSHCEDYYPTHVRDVEMMMRSTIFEEIE